MRVTMRDWLEPSAARWPDPETGPWEVTLSWREGSDGVVVCSGLAMSLLEGADIEPVTATLVRALPVAGLIAGARRDRYARAGGDLFEAVADGQEVAMSSTEVAGLGRASAAWAEPARGRRPDLGTPHYRKVAEVYTRAATASEAPLVAVEEQFHTSRPTASRWVKAAREQGLLPPTERGVARANGLMSLDTEAKKRGKK